jgi:hypothetical protein
MRGSNRRPVQNRLFSLLRRLLFEGNRILRVHRSCFGGLDRRIDRCGWRPGCLGGRLFGPLLFLLRNLVAE